MAPISTSDNILALLRSYYKDGVNSLLFRNSPLLRQIKKNWIEGREVRFNVVHGRGGAVSSNYLYAKAEALETVRSKEFIMTPGQLFSAYTISAKESLASRTNKGAYKSIAGAKSFAAFEAARKTLGKAIYGSGYGEFAKVTTAITTSTSAQTITLPEEAIMAIDVGTVFTGTTVAGLPSAAVGAVKNTVTAINGTSVTFTGSAASEVYPAGSYLVFYGMRTSDNTPLLPQGLEAWLPTAYNRTGANWNTFIAQPYNGVVRANNVNALAGQFTLQGSSEALVPVLQRLFRLVRRAGGIPDMIVMNDRVYAALLTELTPTYFKQQNSKAKGSAASIGLSGESLEFATSFLDIVIDDPYCPADHIYCLDSNTLEFEVLSNIDTVTNDGIGGNEPGRTDVNAASDDDHLNDGGKLLIDNILSVEQGEATQDGPCLVVALNLFANLAVLAPSSNGCAVLTQTF